MDVKFRSKRSRPPRNCSPRIRPKVYSGAIHAVSRDLLPKTVTDHHHCIAPWQTPPVPSTSSSGTKPRPNTGCAPSMDRLAKRERAQEQCIDNTENARVCADAYCEGGDSKSSLPRTTGPKPQCVPDVLKHHASILPILPRCRT